MDQNDRFCPNCGTASASPQPAKTVYPPFAAPSAPTTLYGAVQLAVKQFFKGPLFLTTVIFYTISLLWTLNSPSYEGMISYLIGLLPFDISWILYDNEILDFFFSAPSNATIILQVPSILICVGLWISFGSASSASSQQVSTAGFTIIKVVQIIMCILNILPLAILTFLSVSSIEYLGETFLMFAFVIDVIILFEIIFCVKVVSSLNTVLYTINTGESSNYISMFAAVMLIISGSATALISLNIISTLVTATSSILFGVVFICYKKRMEQGFVVPQNNDSPEH